MREVLSKLEHVQELDIQINVILAKKAEFPARLVGYEADIKTHQTRYDEKKKIVDELDRGKRQQLGALELNEERAKRSQEKVEAIKTNQEYQALQKELESLKKNSTVIQDNANKVGVELDRHRKDLEIIEAALTEAKSKFASESTKIAAETQSIDVELKRLTALRGDAIVGIDKRYLAAYDRVRQGKTGIGIAAAAGGCCKGCNMRIPPQVYNELQRNTEMFTCPSCRRILVYKVPATSAAQSATDANG